jgi:hypothetical protein
MVYLLKFLNVSCDLPVMDDPAGSLHKEESGGVGDEEFQSIPMLSFSRQSRRKAEGPFLGPGTARSRHRLAPFPEQQVCLGKFIYTINYITNISDLELIQ